MNIKAHKKVEFNCDIYSVHCNIFIPYSYLYCCIHVVPVSNFSKLVVSSCRMMLCPYPVTVSMLHRCEGIAISHLWILDICSRFLEWVGIYSVPFYSNGHDLTKNTLPIVRLKEAELSQSIKLRSCSHWQESSWKLCVWIAVVLSNSILGYTPSWSDRWCHTKNDSMWAPQSEHSSGYTPPWDSGTTKWIL